MSQIQELDFQHLTQLLKLKNITSRFNHILNSSVPKLA